MRQPLFVIRWDDAQTDAKGYLVVDTVINGVAGGGIRMHKELTEKEVLDLAQTMTTKFTVVQPQIGGAKSGINYDPDKPDKQDVINRFFEYIEPCLRTFYATGCDLNISEEEIVVAAGRISVRGCPQFSLVKSLNREDRLDVAIDKFNEGLMRLAYDPITIDGDQHPTVNDVSAGYSTALATRHILTYENEPLSGKIAVLQGFGKVGGSCAFFLSKWGIQVNAVSDREGMIYCADGLDIPLLLSRSKKGVVNKAELPYNYNVTTRQKDQADDGLLATEYDILIPAAGSAFINESNIRQVGERCRWIVEGANNPFDAFAKQYLKDRQKTIVPDFVANSGTASMYGILASGKVDISQDAVMAEIGRILKEYMQEIWTEAREKKISFNDAAHAFAFSRLKGYFNDYGDQFKIQ